MSKEVKWCRECDDFISKLYFLNGNICDIAPRDNCVLYKYHIYFKKLLCHVYCTFDRYTYIFVFKNIFFNLKSVFIVGETLVCYLRLYIKLMPPEGLIV